MRHHVPHDPLPCTTAAFAWLQTRAWFRQASRALGLGRPSPVSPEQVTPPDSALAKQAEALAEAAYGPHLLGHAHRTHAIGRVVGAHLGLTVDVEAFYVACLLHDVGLTEAHKGPEPFEKRGAAVAHATCMPDEHRAELAHDAIVMHTSVRAAFGPPEIRLIQSGSGGDLVGLDAELVHPDTMRWIRARWPTTAGFGPHVARALREHTGTHPESPGARLMQLGFGGRIRRFHPQ